MRLRLSVAAAIFLLAPSFYSCRLRAESDDAQPSLAESVFPEKASFAKDISPLLAKYCVGCHSGEKPPGDVILKFKDESDARFRALNDSDFWSKVVDELASKEMPPSRAKNRPSDVERRLLINWIKLDILALMQSFA